jgi:hypothetical protein
MRVAVLFLYLCFFLLRGDAAIYAVTHHDGGHITLQHHKAHRAKHTNQNGPVVMDTQTGDDEEYVIADEDINDDDANEFLAKKMKLLARSYACLSYDSILSYQHNCFTAAPPFYGRKSHIYIIHRTLRI